MDLIRLRRRDADFSEKPIRADGRAEIGSQDFQRDFAVVLEVAREIHRRHSTFADVVLDGIAQHECPRRLHQAARLWLFRAQGHRRYRIRALTAANIA